MQLFSRAVQEIEVATECVPVSLYVSNLGHVSLKSLKKRAGH